MSSCVSCKTCSEAHGSCTVVTRAPRVFGARNREETWVPRWCCLVQFVCFGGLACCGPSERTLLLKRSLFDHGTAAVWRPGIASSLRERRRHCKDHHCVTASAGGKVVDAGRCLAASACVCATEAPCVPVIDIIPSPCAVLTSVPHCAHSSRYWGDWRYRDTCSVCVCSLSPGDCW